MNCYAGSNWRSTRQLIQSRKRLIGPVQLVGEEGGNGRCVGTNEEYPKFYPIRIVGSEDKVRAIPHAVVLSRTRTDTRIDTAAVGWLQ